MPSFIPLAVKGISKELKGIFIIAIGTLVASFIANLSNLIFNFGEIGIAVDLIYLVLTIGFAVLLAYWFSRRTGTLHQEIAKKDHTIRQLQGKGADLRRWTEIHESKFIVNPTEYVGKRIVFRIGNTIKVQLNVYGGRADFYAMPVDFFHQFERTSSWSREERLEEFGAWLLGKNVSSITDDTRIGPITRVLYFVTVKVPGHPQESSCRLIVKRLDPIP